MGITVTKTGAVCGASITGIDLRDELSDDCVAELRSHWVENKVLIFPDQKLEPKDLERFTLYFGNFGDDPFFGHIDGHEHIAAIQRNADEKTKIFAEFYHTDWSFMEVPPAGTILYGITIPPRGGNTLFADQVEAYNRLPDDLREKADQLVAIHSAERAYAPDGTYGEEDRDAGRSMDILPSEAAREHREHPFVRTHRETGKRALFSSPSYILKFKDIDRDESMQLLGAFYQYQTASEVVYSHQWKPDMLLMWDNRSLLHSATGGYDGYDRLLHRTTIADISF